MNRLRRAAPLALAALLIAAALFFEPTWPWRQPRFEHLIVLDITQSMNVVDQRIAGRPASRLAAAKQALQQASEALPCGSRVGWAVFTEYRSYLLFTPVEVCAHRAELRASLAQIDGRMAWAGASEVAKGLNSALAIAHALPGKPSVVFVTDGHEAPPLDARQRPRFDGEPGEVQGLVVGVGDLKPSPIPKLDPEGRPLGSWDSDQVVQTARNVRAGSVAGERYVDERAGDSDAGTLGATPGSEHLSGLREPYLQLLAQERGWAYLRLRGGEGLATALRASAYARPVTVAADLRVALAALAALLVAWPYVAANLAALRRRTATIERS